MTTYKSNKPFTFCPHCENEELYADEPEFDDYTLTLTLNYTCDKCGLEMIEHYSFSDAIIETPNEATLDIGLYEGLSKLVSQNP